MTLKRTVSSVAVKFLRVLMDMMKVPVRFSLTVSLRRYRNIARKDTMIGRILFRVELNILVQICKLLTVFTINAAIPNFDWGRKCQTSFDIQTSESQKRAIIATAAKLLKCDIKTEIPSVTDRYPSPQSLKLDTTLDYFPISLRTMLNKLFVGTDRDEKVDAIGQSIIQAVRPRALVVPLQIGLATQLHHLYKSRFLIDTLSVMGFSSSYGEVQRFLQNAADVVTPDNNNNNNNNCLKSNIQCT